MTALSAAVARRDLLEPTLDAKALNQHQQRIVANPSPECDSLVEHISAVARTATPEQRDHLYAIARLLNDLAHANHAEGECERMVAGAADQLVTDLRDDELNHTVKDRLTAKSIARRLRGPLTVLASPTFASAAALVEAIRVVDDVLARASTGLLLSVAVRHELGVAKFTLLSELHASRKASV